MKGNDTSRGRWAGRQVGQPVRTSKDKTRGKSVGFMISQEKIDGVGAVPSKRRIFTPLQVPVYSPLLPPRSNYKRAFIRGSFRLSRIDKKIDISNIIDNPERFAYLLNPFHLPLLLLPRFSFFFPEKSQRFMKMCLSEYPESSFALTLLNII